MIQFKNLRKSYETDRPVLKNISGSFPAGSITGVLGPNGAGKTTLISILTGLISQDGGEIQFRGDSSKNSLKQMLNVTSVVPQELAFYDNLTVIQNLRFFGGVQGLTGKNLQSGIDQAIHISGLQSFTSYRAGHLSGGLKRRLNLAIGVINSPDILYLDEPTVGIDPQSRNFILESVQQMKKQGRLIVYTSHYMEEVQRISDHIIIMDEGKILKTGNLKTILDNDNKLTLTVESPVNGELKALLSSRQIGISADLRKIFLAEDFENLGEIIEMIKFHGYVISTVSSHSQDLEDVFLSLTGKGLRD